MTLQQKISDSVRASVYDSASYSVSCSVNNSVYDSDDYRMIKNHSLEQ
jgi:hypothetical protein